VVTGAGRGIGRAVAIKLSNEGYAVALTSRSANELELTAALCPGKTMAIAADITEPQAADDIFSAVEAEWGGVDVLVANAGSGVSAPLARTTDELWESMLALNLTAPFRCIRRAVPDMVERGFGRVVVVASTAAKHGEPYISAYTASKHGVLGLVRSVAAEVAAKGVTVNAVCPGYVATPMTDRTIETIVSMTGRTPEQARATLEAKQPNGRLVEPDEVSDVIWMCMTNASMNGQGVNVDGGGVQS
jgi:NAD(P)-dependent dehydrogenase (short-subunit alcohol dehydrogenase family)